VKHFAFCVAAIGVVLATFELRGAEVIPPKPAHYFNDYAGIVSQSAADQFDRQLARFEIDTSNQVVVAIFPKMQSEDDVAAYAQRVAESWGVGQKDKRNGVVLFVFVEDRKMIIQVGYGLEGALPDVTAFNITEYVMKPQFVAGNYQAGLRAGIDSILNTIRGEYKGSGATTGEQRATKRRPLVPLLFFGFLLLLSLLFGLHRTARQGVGISSKGAHWTIDWGNVVFFWINLLLSSSGRGSGGGGSSSSSGGFSGGGGSFGGGGAGSSW
jgi:uncharacterized protein